MQYNIHPIFVHFPIALLFVYSLLKIIPLKRWLPSINWIDIQRIFLIIGILGAFVALSTGEMAEHLVRSNHALVESHAFFATAATWLYGVLLIGEIFSILMHSKKFSVLPESFQKIISFLSKVLSQGVVSVVIAVIGLVCISIAGMLGGIIVYGTTADPFAKGLLQILGIAL